MRAGRPDVNILVAEEGIIFHVAPKLLKFKLVIKIRYQPS
jgi:hypothetical protein